MKLIVYSLLLILISCGGAPTKDYKVPSDITIYRGNGIEQFFLPELPKWGNRSQTGQCFRQFSVKYIDQEKLKLVHQLSYPEAIELQVQLNQKLEEYYENTVVKFLRPVEEAALFNNTLEQVKGGVKALKLPAVSQIELIWIDDYIMNNKEADFIKWANSSQFTENLPVLVSLCKTSTELKKWAQARNVDSVGLYYAGYEWLSPFTKDQTMAPVERNYLNDFGQIKVIPRTAGSVWPAEIVIKK